MKLNLSIVKNMFLFSIVMASGVEMAHANQDTLAIGKEAQRFLDAVNSHPNVYDQIASQPLEVTYANAIVFGIRIAKCHRDYGRDCSLAEVIETALPNSSELVAMIEKSSGKVQRLLMSALLVPRSVKITSLKSVGASQSASSSSEGGEEAMTYRQAIGMPLAQTMPLSLLELLRDNGLLRTLYALPGVFLYYPSGLSIFGLTISAGTILAAIPVAVLVAIGAVVGGALYYEYYEELSQVESFSDYIHSTGDGAVGVGEYYWELVTEGSFTDWWTDLHNAF